MKATIYDFKRYCQNVSCKECEIYNEENGCVYSMSYSNLDYINKVITEWCASHPVKTRKTEFMKLFPNCKLDEDGYLVTPCVQRYDKTIDCPIIKGCKNCISKFWDKEV